MKKLLIVVVLLTSFLGGRASGEDVIFIGGLGSLAYEAREFGEAVGANITIPLPGNVVQQLFVGYPADKIYEQLQACGLTKRHPIVIAHSWGGRVICRIMADHPEFTPEKVIFVGSPLGNLPGSPPPWLFGEVVCRSDVPIYVMTSTGDKTVSISSATALPDASEAIVLEGVEHTGYFTDARGSAKIKAWVNAPIVPIFLSSR